MNDTVNTEMVAFDSPSHLFKMEMRKRCTEDEQEKKKEKKEKEKKKKLQGKVRQCKASLGIHTMNTINSVPGTVLL